ncbi:MAG: patatin-like phospholipase family protein, partial [Actinobacteria bacterium]|nr:patatin-like phospholipase family protein [Actinomycetota bacterium]
MNAFVLSGAGNRGAMEAGALIALLEAGISPGLLAGSSSGAINAAYIAGSPSLEGARSLAE